MKKLNSFESGAPQKNGRVFKLVIYFSFAIILFLPLVFAYAIFFKKTKTNFIPKKIDMESSYANLMEEDITTSVFNDCSVSENQEIKSPLTVKGLADWRFFPEGYFFVILKDGNGKEIYSTTANADAYPLAPDENGYMKFVAELIFVNPETENGTIVFKQNKTSGLKEIADFVIPIKFKKSSEMEMSLKFLDKSNLISSEGVRQNFFDYIKAYDTAIEIVEVYDFNDGMKGFFVDSSGHAQYIDYTSSAYGKTKSVKIDTKGIESAALAKNISIPSEADYMFFNYKFNIAEKGNVLEVFINDKRIFALNAEGKKQSEVAYLAPPGENTWAEFDSESLDTKESIVNKWLESGGISVKDYSGQEAQLVIRLGNANKDDGFYSVVEIDNIIFAKIDK